MKGAKFIQIAVSAAYYENSIAVDESLMALDEASGVWRYVHGYPPNGRYKREPSYWIKLTNQRKEPKK